MNPKVASISLLALAVCLAVVNAGKLRPRREYYGKYNHTGKYYQYYHKRGYEPTEAPPTEEAGTEAPTPFVERDRDGNPAPGPGEENGGEEAGEEGGEYGKEEAGEEGGEYGEEEPEEKGGEEGGEEPGKEGEEAGEEAGEEGEGKGGEEPEKEAGEKMGTTKEMAKHEGSGDTDADKHKGYCHWGIAIWFKPGYFQRCNCMKCTCQTGGKWKCDYHFPYCPYFYCGNHIYNPKSHICCCGKLYEKKHNHHCCGHYYYDTKHSKCCNYYSVRPMHSHCPRDKI